MKILIVDDNSDVLEALKAYIGRAGVDVVCCLSPETALKELGWTQFDLIITDFNMPHMNGKQFAEFARKLTTAKIVLHTGEPDMTLEKDSPIDCMVPKCDYKAIKKLLSDFGMEARI